MTKQENTELFIFKTTEELIDFGIGKLVNICTKTIQSQDRCVIALSGGKTPLFFFQKLSRINDNLLWNKIHIFLVDERLVPYDNPESNYHMIKKHLLDVVDIPKENIYSMSIEEKADISARKFEKQIQRFFSLQEGQMPQFDLIMLGIGKDGHTASLFPNNTALLEEKHLAISVRADHLRHQRITLTLPVINNAKNVIFVVTGKNKAEVIKEVIEKAESKLPAAMVNPKEGKKYFLLDSDAGSLLVGGRP